MKFLALFAAEEDQLDLGAAAAPALFQCAAPACPTASPDEGANAAVLLDEAPRSRGARGWPSPPRPRSTPPWKGSRSRRSRAPSGGFPAWVQDEEIPSCAECRAPMRFVLQLDGDEIGANVGDAGLGYAFVCHGAKFLWQCA